LYCENKIESPLLFLEKGSQFHPFISSKEVMPSSYIDAVRNYYEILKHVSQELWQFIWHGIWQFSVGVISSGSQECLSVVSPLLLCLGRAAGLTCCPSLFWQLL